MSSTALKLLALVLMFIDHIGEFIPSTPLFLRYIGRLSAPLFIFTMAWGFHYTSSRKRYLTRMYLCSVGMAVMALWLNSLFGASAYQPIVNNIFSTLFLTGMLIALIEITKKSRKEGLKWWILFLLWQVFSTVLCTFVGGMGTFVFGLEIDIFALLGAVTGNIFLCEGGFIIVILGILLYFNKETKKSLTLAYGIFVLIYTALSVQMLVSMGYGLTGLLTIDYQWMMIFALPFMLAYNGEKGKGYKYLFYIFYPLHIAILFLLGNLVF